MRPDLCRGVFVLRNFDVLFGCASLLALCPGTSYGQAAEPFSTRNLNPPIAILALPNWRPVPAAPVFSASFELANHYRLSRSGTDGLLLDGETTRLSVRYEQPFGSGWSVAAEVPFFEQGGGVLDDVIDGWHSAFRLPDGARNARPEDVLELRMVGTAGAPFGLAEDDRGFGDVMLSVARSFGASSDFTVRATVKLPTGDESILAGSGSTDWMLTVLRSRDIELRRRSAGFYWGGGVIRAGDSRPVPYVAEDSVATALVGGGLSVRRRLGFKGQIEVHTPFYDSPLEEVGQTAVQVSLGGWLSFERGGRLEFAVGEDLHVSTAPDVMLHMAMRWNR